MKNTILIDLDGTLLPLDQDSFLMDYFSLLKKYFNSLGLNEEEVIKALKDATRVMINNDGMMTNEKLFASTFSVLSKIDYSVLEPKLLKFYENDFGKLRIHAQQNPLANEIINILTQKGYLIILATNPVFPKIATHKRIFWAGLSPNDFNLVTTFENSSFCKPKIGYYQEILNSINKKPQEAIMIGNNVEEDMIVQNINIDTFLLTDYIINPNNIDITNYKHGNYGDLLAYIKDLPNLKE